MNWTNKERLKWAGVLVLCALTFFGLGYSLGSKVSHEATLRYVKDLLSSFV